MKNSVKLNVDSIDGHRPLTNLEGPTKIKAHKSFLFTEGSFKVESKEHLFDFVVTLYFTSLCCNAQAVANLIC